MEHITDLILPLLALGVTAGFLAGLLGIGGGAVLVPGLFYILGLGGFPEHLLMHTAVGTSLAVIVPTGLSSARAHFKRHSVDLNLLKTMGTGIAIGALGGSFLAGLLSAHILKIIFAVMIALLALVMLVNPARFVLRESMPRQPWPSLAGGFIGVLSALIGIGGATLSVPYMSLHNIRIHTAIGTAAALGLFISIPATLGFIYTGLGAENMPPLSLGYIYLPAWALIILGSVMAAPLGARASHAIPVPLMKKGFAVFMVLVALKMASEVL